MWMRVWSCIDGGAGKRSSFLPNGESDGAAEGIGKMDVGWEKSVDVCWGILILIPGYGLEVGRYHNGIWKVWRVEGSVLCYCV